MNDVDCIFYSYYGQHLEAEVKMQVFQPTTYENGIYGYENRPDMIQRGWELYVEHVKTNEMLTLSKGEEIKDKVFEEFFPKKEEKKAVWKRGRKEDKTDINKFVENKKKEREKIDIAAIVVEDWEKDEKKREEEQKEYLERESRLLKLLNELN